MILYLLLFVGFFFPKCVKLWNFGRKLGMCVHIGTHTNIYMYLCFNEANWEFWEQLCLLEPRMCYLLPPAPVWRAWRFWWLWDFFFCFCFFPWNLCYHLWQHDETWIVSDVLACLAQSDTTLSGKSECFMEFSFLASFFFWFYVRCSRRKKLRREVPVWWSSHTALGNRKFCLCVFLFYIIN